MADSNAEAPKVFSETCLTRTNDSSLDDHDQKFSDKSKLKWFYEKIRIFQDFYKQVATELDRKIIYE